MAASSGYTRPLVDAQAFRDAMSLLAVPVTVVTGTDQAGQRWGFTASSVTSVSLDPPMVLVGLAKSSSCRSGLLGSSEFAVNVLGDDHRDIAKRFATKDVDRFQGSGFTTWPGTDLPCLAGAHALLRCALWDILPAGDHELVLGMVTDTRASGTSTPLIWYERAFHTPS